MNSNLSYNLETPNLGQIRWFFELCNLEIWRMTLKNKRAPLLSNRVGVKYFWKYLSQVQVVFKFASTSSSTHSTWMASSTSSTFSIKYKYKYQVLWYNSTISLVQNLCTNITLVHTVTYKVKISFKYAPKITFIHEINHGFINCVSATQPCLWIMWLITEDHDSLLSEILQTQFPKPQIYFPWWTQHENIPNAHGSVYCR